MSDITDGAANTMMVAETGARERVVASGWSGDGPWYGSCGSLTLGLAGNSVARMAGACWWP